MTTKATGIEKEIKSEKLNLDLGYRKIVDLLYNCNTGNIILTLGGYLNKQVFEERGIEACLESKKIVLNTKKEFIKKPVMRPALGKDGAYRYDSAGILQLEESGEFIDEWVNQENYIELKKIDLNLTQIYDFLKTYGEFAL